MQAMRPETRMKKTARESGMVTSLTRRLLRSSVVLLAAWEASVELLSRGSVPAYPTGILRSSAGYRG